MRPSFDGIRSTETTYSDLSAARTWSTTTAKTVQIDADVVRSRCAGRSASPRLSTITYTFTASCIAGDADKAGDHHSRTAEAASVVRRLAPHDRRRRNIDDLMDRSE